MLDRLGSEFMVVVGPFGAWRRGTGKEGHRRAGFQVCWRAGSGGTPAPSWQLECPLPPPVTEAGPGRAGSTGQLRHREAQERQRHWPWATRQDELLSPGSAPSFPDLWVWQGRTQRHSVILCARAQRARAVWTRRAEGQGLRGPAPRTGRWGCGLPGEGSG